MKQLKIPQEACFIYCKKCQKVTLHECVRNKDRIVVKINGKIVAFKIKFKCQKCGQTVTFKQKAL